MAFLLCVLNNLTLCVFSQFVAFYQNVPPITKYIQPRTLRSHTLRCFAPTIYRKVRGLCVLKQTDKRCVETPFSPRYERQS